MRYTIRRYTNSLILVPYNKYVNPFLTIKRADNERKLVSLEMLRGIAAFFVCYYHLTGEGSLTKENIFRKMGTWGWSGVEIFFVISGFVIPYAMYSKNYAPKNFFTFLKKRVIRIEPPYLISVVLIIVLNYVSTLSPYYRGAPFSFNLVNTLSHIGYINAFTGQTWLNPAYWTLAIEFQYYILVALCFGLLTSTNKYIRIGISLVLLSTSFLPFPKESLIFYYIGYFVLGISLFQYYSKVSSLWEFLTMALISALLIFYTHNLVLVLIALSTAFIIIQVHKVPPILQKLGLFSYSLYLLHIPIGGRFVNLCGALTTNETYRTIAAFAGIAVSLFASYWFYRFVERYSQKMAARIKYK
jgi:peptidoglycan/LPS O-acetylase OafA/YrhL